MFFLVYPKKNTFSGYAHGKKFFDKNITHQNNSSNPYYNFKCKCFNLNEENNFESFQAFLNHIINKHNIKDLNLKMLNNDIIPKYNNRFQRGIKYYWGLHCSCGKIFTSSLCNADLLIKDNKIIISKIYNLQCNNCNKIADFKNKKLLEKYLKERLLQKLIYKHYETEFNKYNNDKEYNKILEGHIPELCEKCKMLPDGINCYDI